MGKKNLYSITRVTSDIPNVQKFLCTKLSEDLEPEGTYNLEVAGNTGVCDCVAGNMRKDCRHLQMLRLFHKNQAFGKALYNFNKKTWVNQDTPSDEDI